MADDKIIKIGDTKFALHPEVYGLLEKLNTENKNFREAIMEWYGQEERDISPRSALYPLAEIAKTYLPKGSTVAEDTPEDDSPEDDSPEDDNPEEDAPEESPEETEEPDEYDDEEEEEEEEPEEKPARKRRPQRKN